MRFLITILFLIPFFLSAQIAPQIKDPIVEFIKEKEGLETKSYEDAVGVWTIGYGHTSNVNPNMVISEDRAEQLLRQDARRFEKYVYRKAERPLKWYQFGALVSFTFNLGYRLRGDLLRGIRTGDDALVTYKMKLYKYAGGRILRGLVIRRREEALFYVGDKAIIRRFSRCK